ncbi:hypothetical protein [Leptolyngbya sp. FACHB-261]|uniref:hypothetical protein n=1 Tax=Leptolyngbya sp. FACHB-261 TaxID=2692806 RepID=UPI001687827A|nr:hypothetical protein [Leptolyngbya sp. FACHB-261]MBD2105054.1 hypothetical protein [Leptolyngbya sp. FACHB-261]
MPQAYRPRFQLTAASLLLSLTLPFLPPWSPLVRASQIWEVVGQPVLELAAPPNGGIAKLEQWNTRIEEIAAELSPNQALTVTVVPILGPASSTPRPTPFPATSLPSSSPAVPLPLPRPEVIRATIQINGRTLLEITPEEALSQGAGSVAELANRWADSLRRNLNRPEVRRRLAAVAGMPHQISYDRQAYQRGIEASSDRGLFLSNGARTSGQVVFWEIPSNQAYQYTGILASTVRSLHGQSASPEATSTTTPAAPATIYLLNRHRQFIPYARAASPSP